MVTRPSAYPSADYVMPTMAERLGFAGAGLTALILLGFAAWAVATGCPLRSVVGLIVYALLFSLLQLTVALVARARRMGRRRERAVFIASLEAEVADERESI